MKSVVSAFAKADADGMYLCNAYSPYAAIAGNGSYAYYLLNRVGIFDKPCGSSGMTNMTDSYIKLSQINDPNLQFKAVCCSYTSAISDCNYCLRPSATQTMSLDDYKVNFYIEDNVGSLKILSSHNKIQQITPIGLSSDP